MKIAVYGLGRIGSTFAFHLAQAGHAVTAVSRGTRFAELERDSAIVKADGARAPVIATDVLDLQAPYDLVLVTVLAHQVDAVLPQLSTCRAKTVMFMFNTFEPLERLRLAVGPERFAFGFPAILATLDGGKLTSSVYTRGQLTTVTDPAWAKVFSEAGILTTTEPDMESWLRTHAALVVPFMLVAGTSYQRNAGLAWSEAAAHARAMKEGFALVRALGNSLRPSFAARLAGLPTGLFTALLWVAGRVKSLRLTGATGFGEPRALIDAMIAHAPPASLPTLRTLRPN